MCREAVDPIQGPELRLHHAEHLKDHLAMGVAVVAEGVCIGRVTALRRGGAHSLQPSISSCLCFKRLLLLKLATRWNGNGGTKSKSERRRTREQATKVKPEENSFLPTSMTTLSSVYPWDLCMVTAQDGFRGS